MMLMPEPLSGIGRSPCERAAAINVSSAGSASVSDPLSNKWRTWLPSPVIAPPSDEHSPDTVTVEAGLISPGTRYKMKGPPTWAGLSGLCDG
jgi:hypothetical protein